MATCKTWYYPQDNKYVIQFKKLFSQVDNITINQWYSIDNGITYIYENDKFYYHMATVKKNQLGYYIEDYVLTRKGELKYNKEFGYFKAKEELIEVIKQNTLVA